MDHEKILRRFCKKNHPHHHQPKTKNMKYYAYMPSLVVGCCTLILSKYEKKEEDTTFFSSVLLKLYIQPPYCAIFPPCPPLTSYPCPSFYSLFKTGSLCRGNQKIGRIFFLGHLDLPKKTDAPNYYYDPYICHLFTS